MSFRRRRLEWAIAAVLAMILLCIVLTRVDTVSDDVKRQALMTMGAHFSAGVAMLQARQRAASAKVELNALGYPVSSRGSVETAEDCREVWERVMADAEEAVVVARAVSDGRGERCEFELALQTTPQGRVLYWPGGAPARTAMVNGRPLGIAPGEHVFVDLEESEAIVPL
jgi:hypothetical protein